MDKTFCFALEKEEYVEYLSWQLNTSKSMRGYRWFLITSVPAVLVTGTLVLRLNNWMFLASMLALAVMWVLYGAKAVWKRYLHHKITVKFLPKMQFQSFREVSYRFTDTGIEYQEDRKKKTLPWKKVSGMLPLGSQFAFFYDKGAILLPYRLFEGEEDMKNFLRDYELLRKRAQEAK